MRLSSEMLKNNSQSNGGRFSVQKSLDRRETIQAAQDITDFNDRYVH